MFNKLREDTEKRILEAEEDINALKNNPDSKDIIEKLLSLDKQFLYGIFHPILRSFDRIENIEHNYGVLNQHIFDDNFIYLKEEVHPIEKSMKDRLNEVLKGRGEPERPYTTYLKPNLREEGTICDILKFIDDAEKREINGLNIQIDINRKRGFDSKSDFRALKERLSGFDEKNIELLDSELKERL